MLRTDPRSAEMLSAAGPSPAGAASGSAALGPAAASKGAPLANASSFAGPGPLGAWTVARGASQRIDPPHPLAGGTPQPGEPIPSPESGAEEPDSGEADFAACESLLKLHAADLIERLQAWARDLDARESQINMRSALQDHRERQFRLWAQSHRADLEESVRAHEQRDKDLRDSARRLAILELSQHLR